MYGEDGVLHMDLMNKQKIDPKSQKFAENWFSYLNGKPFGKQIGQEVRN